MRLKKLELYGFKSFPERTEIVFKEGITAIAGCSVSKARKSCAAPACRT